MKTSSVITAGFIILLATSVTAVNARQLEIEPPVKILPTTEYGILKLLFASNADQGVEVKFYNEDGLLSSDKIKRNLYPHGFSKKYDVRHLKPGSFWVEISSPQMDVTYKLNESKDGRSIEPFLEKTTYNHPMVVAKN